MEGISYKRRMAAAHRLLAKIEEVKAAIFELSTHKGQWDNQTSVDVALGELYHYCDHARDTLTTGTNVAHYG